MKKPETVYITYEMIDEAGMAGAISEESFEFLLEKAVNKAGLTFEDESWMADELDFTPETMRTVDEFLNFCLQEALYMYRQGYFPLTHAQLDTAIENLLENDVRELDHIYFYSHVALTKEQLYKLEKRLKTHWEVKKNIGAGI